jgi:hypothetical protein
LHTVVLLDLDGRLSVDGNNNVGVAAFFVVTLKPGADFAAPEICELGVVVLVTAPRASHFALKPSCGLVVPLEIGHLVPLFLLF